jgi:hypothetical protein
VVVSKISIADLPSASPLIRNVVAAVIVHVINDVLKLIVDVINSVLAEKLS